jgi:hypothetical protein
VGELTTYCTLTFGADVSGAPCVPVRGHMRELDDVLRIATSAVPHHFIWSPPTASVLGYCLYNQEHVVSSAACCGQSVTAHCAEARALGRASLLAEAPSLAAYEHMCLFLFKAVPRISRIAAWVPGPWGSVASYHMVNGVALLYSRPV